MLLVRRTYDKHDPGEARARWEVPGGKVDPGETPWQAALREWSEETGATLGVEPCAGWKLGDYEGFIARVDHESDLRLDPDGHEVSDAGWWEVSQLSDERVRDKVVESLGLITPLLKASFHRHTDRIIDHYTPKMRSALRQVYQGDTVRQAIRAAYGVRKATTTTRRLTPAASAAVGVGAGVGAAGVGMGAAGGAAALGVLSAAGTSTAALAAVLAALYVDAYLQGGHEAAEAAHGVPTPTVAEVPADYWDDWKPGIQVTPGPTLSQLLAEATVVIREVTGTQLDRIGAAITKGINDGLSIAEVEEQVAAILDTEARAWLITETEYARAMTAAARETYRLNNVPKVQWLHQPGACARCMANAAVSPIPVTDSWPSGNVPVHPRCRCAEAPAFT